MAQMIIKRLTQIETFGLQLDHWTNGRRENVLLISAPAIDNKFRQILKLLNLFLIQVQHRIWQFRKSIPPSEKSIKIGKNVSLFKLITVHRWLQPAVRKFTEVTVESDTDDIEEQFLVEGQEEIRTVDLFWKFADVARIEWIIQCGTQ